MALKTSEITVNITIEIRQVENGWVIYFGAPYTGKERTIYVAENLESLLMVFRKIGSVATGQS